MLARYLTIATCGFLFASVQALPNPVPESVPEPSQTISLPGGVIIIGDPISTFKIEKKDDGQKIGDVDSEFSWDVPEPAPIQINKREPQFTIGTPTVTFGWETAAPTPRSCECEAGTVAGKYCGFCNQIAGNWVSWNAYRCSSSGDCQSLGFARQCVDGTPKQCPSIQFD